MFRYLVILSLALIIEACSTTKIVQLPPIQPPPGITAGQIESAIRAAINSYNGAWTVEDSQSGAIIAGLHVRNHYMEVEIDYTELSISSNIISSKNLKQDDDSIHKRALYWQNRLYTSIKQEIGKLNPIKTDSKISNEPDTQTSKEISNALLTEPGKGKQKEPEPKTQDQASFETPKETGSQILERTILEILEEPALQSPEEPGLETLDETNSKRTWKTYFEIQDEKAQNVK